MKKRILAAALCLTLLSGCGARPPLDLPDAESDRAVIAYVPLDDRPDNVGRVEYLAESLGYVLNMPEEWMFKTLLDGQMEDYYAENGLETQSWTGQSGYPGLLYDWVLEQEASGCDRYLLSVDQLLYGGLVASRLAETTTERDGEPWPLTDLLESLLSALAEDPNNEVWLLDSVMRLAPTVGYAGGTLEYYNAMRTIGAAPRKTLTGDELTLENIRATYDTDADGHDLLRFEDSAMYDAALRYTEHRINKLTLSGELLETVSRIGGDRFHVLIGIDDSSSEDCIQKNEIAYLQARLRAGDVILSGVDDLAFKAVTKLYLNEVSWNGAGVNVQYFGGTEDRPACDYDYKPLTEIVAEHLGYKDADDMLVNIGEIYCEGVNPSGKPWTIGVDMPEDGNMELGGAGLVGIWQGDGSGCGVVTSGNYRKFYVKDGRKYSHTVDPRTGYPVSHSLLSATIVAPDATLADAYATYCMVIGLEESRKFIESSEDIEGYLVYADGDSMAEWASSGFNLVRE